MQYLLSALLDDDDTLSAIIAVAIIVVVFASCMLAITIKRNKENKAVEDQLKERKRIEEEVASEHQAKVNDDAAKEEGSVTANEKPAQKPLAQTVQPAPKPVAAAQPAAQTVQPAPKPVAAAQPAAQTAQSAHKPMGFVASTVAPKQPADGTDAN